MNLTMDKTAFRSGETLTYRQRVETYPFLHAVARGIIPGAGTFRVIGKNADIDNAREDLWETGGDYVFPPDAGVQMQVISTSAADAPAGTGARTVDIHYLDADGYEREETVVLNGTSAVNTVATNIRRVQDFHVKTAGSSASAGGTITLRNTTATATYSSIQPGNGRARQAIWTVPAGKVAYITEAWIGGNADGGSLANYAEGYLRGTCDFSGELTPGIFNYKWGSISASSALGGEITVPIIAPALCDIKMSAISRAVTSNVLVVGGFAGWYEPA